MSERIRPPHASRKALDERRHSDEYRAVRGILEDVARRGGTISYEELAARVDQRVCGARLYATNKELWHLLSRLSEEEAVAGRPLLPVLVVHQSRDHLPGPGFFELARRLGRMPKDADEASFAERETSAVHEHWSRALARQR